jgi:acetyl esterase/lipase
MIGVNLCALERSPSVFAFVDLWGVLGRRRATPIDRHFPPTVIVHGTADQLVPYERSEELARTLEEKGVRCPCIPFRTRHTTRGPHGRIRRCGSGLPVRRPAGREAVADVAPTRCRSSLQTLERAQREALGGEGRD